MGCIDSWHLLERVESRLVARKQERKKAVRNGSTRLSLNKNGKTKNKNKNNVPSVQSSSPLQRERRGLWESEREIRGYLQAADGSFIVRRKTAVALFTIKNTLCERRTHQVECREAEEEEESKKARRYASGREKREREERERTQWGLYYVYTLYWLVLLLLRACDALKPYPMQLMLSRSLFFFFCCCCYFACN